MKLQLKYIKKRIYRLEVSPHDIRKKFGDLRFRKTWEMAYKHYVDKNNIVAFVPPSPPVHNPIVKPQPLLPPARELPALPPAKIPERPSDRLTDYEHSLLFGEPNYVADDSGQLLLFDIIDVEPPDPDDYPDDYEYQHQLWEKRFPKHAAACRHWNEIIENLIEWKEEVKRLTGKKDTDSEPINLLPFGQKIISAKKSVVSSNFDVNPKNRGGNTARYSHPIDYG